MAFSKTPQTSTYQTKNVSLLNEWETRNSSTSQSPLSERDNDAINCFYEIIQNKKTGDKEHWVVKRSGTVAYPYTPVVNPIRGLHYWKDQDKLFLAISDDIYIITASTGALVTTLSTVFGTTDGRVGFCEFLYDDNSVKIVATDGTTLVTIDSSNTKVVGADADMPTPHLPYPVFLDGYLFLVKASTADIYNSNLNDPLAYTSGDFISAEMNADKVSALAVLNNYVIAFGTSAVEYFFDAANASGSPLQRYEVPIKNIGFLGGLTKYASKLIFVGNYNSGPPEVFILEDLKVDSISTPPIIRDGSYSLNPVELTYPPACNVIHFQGHTFICLSYRVGVSFFSYIYDLETKLWTKLSLDSLGGANIDHAVTINIANSGGSADKSLRSLINVGPNADLRYFSDTDYQDLGVNFTMTVITDNQMFDTYRNKTCSRLLVYGDQTSTSANLGVSWSDDDYQNFSTARDVDMSLDFPVLHRLGQFRRRAFKLEWTQNLPMRLRHLELDLNLGQA